MGFKNSDLAGLKLNLSNMLAGGKRADMFAAYHRTCGHAVLVGPDRATITNIIGNLRGSGRFALRVRMATADDIESATRGITCNLCRSLV